MFTGIVQATCPVVRITPLEKQTQVTIKLTAPLIEGLAIGASVSILGTCLTVVKINELEVSFDLIAETLQRTSLGDLKVGSIVNVERSLRVGDEIGGHLLSGHVMGKATIEQIEHISADQRAVLLRCDPNWMKYIFTKGYIALNGASLTVVDVDPKGTFSVHLIPETLRMTTFGTAKVGDKVNVEIDSQTQMIVDTVAKIPR